MLLLLLSLQAEAARPPVDSALSLATAQSIGRERNPRIQAARSAVAAASAAARQAGALRDPTSTVAREQTGSRVWQSTVLLDQPLDFLGPLSMRRAAGRAHVAVAEQSLRATLRQVEAEVTTAYAAARASERELALADSMAAAFDRAVRIIEARVKEGDASGYQARRLRLEAARYEGVRAEARARRREAHGRLATLLGRDPAGSFELTDSLAVIPPEIAADSLAALAANADGRVAVAAARAQAAAADVARLRRERMPVPSLGLGYKEERAGTSQRLSGYVAQVSLPIPIWGSRGAALAAGVAEADRLSALVAEARLAARRDALAGAGHAAALSQRHAALVVRLGSEANRARLAADGAFAEGEMTLVEWLDAVRAFHDAAVEEASVAAAFAARVAELERLTGTDLLVR